MVTDIKIKWYKSPIAKDKFKALTKKSDFKALRYVGLHLAFSISTALFAFYSFHNLPWFVTLAAVYIHGTFYNFWVCSQGYMSAPMVPFLDLRQLINTSILFSEFSHGIIPRSSKRVTTDIHQVTVHSGYDLEVVLPVRFRPID